MHIFMNPNEQRPRAGWRLAAQLLMLIVIEAIIILLFSLFTNFSGNKFYLSAMAGAAVISIWIAIKGFDRRSWTDLGLVFNTQSMAQYAVGFILAGVVMGLLFLIEYWLGWISITGFGWRHSTGLSFATSFTGYFLLMIVVGFYEELVFRGYQITNLSEGLHFASITKNQAVLGAAALSSIIFGVMHFANPGASWISTINVALAGGMLAFPFIITGRLSLSIGVHIGWNFFQGGIFGFHVSGLPDSSALLLIHQHGPAAITGGVFGPEAGLLGILGMLLVTAGLVVGFMVQNHPLRMHANLAVYQAE